MAIKLMRIIEIVAIAMVITPITLAIREEDYYYNRNHGENLDLYDSSLYYNEYYNHKEASAPEPYPGQVEECLQNISDDCGIIIFNRILDSGKYSDVEECCPQLLALGIKCHNVIMESTLLSPEMKGVNTTEIWKNSDKLWEECTSS
ncbi:hypothetical protein R3W88_028766 [Solanum pinnatisectum]|uniref:Prolamin-like domain-containing protein n=1 Tax=Solanum pinnatisectum TaxID=50273 RepID=A0AAV9K3U6_9SOLN|nr:hypothetical protein R3W88_028766 [Solanum pinnatisectum]